MSIALSSRVLSAGIVVGNQFVFFYEKLNDSTVVDVFFRLNYFRGLFEFLSNDLGGIIFKHVLHGVNLSVDGSEIEPVEVGDKLSIKTHHSLGVQLEESVGKLKNAFSLDILELDVPEEALDDYVSEYSLEHVTDINFNLCLTLVLLLGFNIVQNLVGYSQDQRNLALDEVEVKYMTHYLLFALPLVPLT